MGLDPSQIVSLGLSRIQQRGPQVQCPVSLAGDMQGPLCGSINLLTWPLQRGPRIFSPLRGRTLPRGGGAGSGATGSCDAASQTSPRAPS